MNNTATYINWSKYILTMVYTYLPKLTNLQQGIFRALSVMAGSSMNQRGLARMLNVTPPAIIKALAGLKKIVRCEQDPDSRRWSIKLNLDDYHVVQLKRADNLRQIYETGFAEFLEERFAGATIILFGSYSRGEDTVTSDIDIAVIGRKEKTVKLQQFEKRLKRKINISFYDDFKIHKNLRESLCNGIVLCGGIEF